MHQRILFVADNLPRASFFSRFAPVCQASGIRYRFLAGRWSVHRFLRRRGYDSWLISPRGRGCSDQRADWKLACAGCHEVLRGETTMRRACRAAAGLAFELRQQIRDFDPSHICLWNGSQLIARLIDQIASPQVERRYFEIANLPGKLFVDAAGVNAASSVYANPDRLLLRGVPDDHEYVAWRRGYLACRDRPVPQARAALALQWERPVDALAARLGFGFYPIRWGAMVSRLSGKLASRRLCQNLLSHFQAGFDCDSPYAFFPLQVSDDTQIVIHSDVDNLAALRAVHAECRQAGLQLVVKIHPAENSRRALVQLAEVLAELSADGNIVLSGLPTPTLIERAAQVYVINSTVGLETIIAQRPLKILGRSLFSALIDRPDLMKCYILRYLVDFDYFGTAPAAFSTLQRVLEHWSPSSARVA